MLRAGRGSRRDGPPCSRCSRPEFFAVPSPCDGRRSKGNAGAQLHLVPLEIDEIERARASRYRAPDLHVPRRRDKISFAEGRVEGWADIERLSRETVEAEPLVMTKAARFRADKDVRHHLHRERRA